MFKIQTLNNISSSGLSRLPADRYNVGNDVADPDGVLVRSADMRTQPLATTIKAVARAGAGVNNIPVAELSLRGVPVFNAPGANANAVKELVVAGMLMAARNLGDALSFVVGLSADGEVHKRVEAEKKRFVGSELSGKTLGVVGLGAIGVKVANAGHALGMRVLGFDPHMTIDGAWALSSDVDKATSLDELYSTSDYITFHVPLNDATRGIFGAAALELRTSRRGASSISRVTASSTMRRCDAGLGDGKIGRYVTDFPSAELLGNARVIGLPHLGASTGEAEENCAVMVVDQLREFLESGNVHNAVNFPNTRMARAVRGRLCIANKNRPNMIGQLSHVLGEAGVNIAQMHNASRGDIAYTLIDLDSPASDALVRRSARIEGILSVRAIEH